MQQHDGFSVANLATRHLRQRVVQRELQHCDVFALMRLGAAIDEKRGMTIGYGGSASDGGVRVPDERYGLVFVFRVFDRVSYALVMNVSRPVKPLDVVQTP